MAETTVFDRFVDLDDFECLLDDARLQASTDWEVSFVKDLASRFSKYKGAMTLSDKQEQTLRDLAGPADF